MRKLDGLRRGAGGKAVDGVRLRVGGNPGRVPGLKKIEILQRRGRDQRTVDCVEGDGCETGLPLCGCASSCCACASACNCAACCAKSTITARNRHFSVRLP